MTGFQEGRTFERSTNGHGHHGCQETPFAKLQTIDLGRSSSEEPEPHSELSQQPSIQSQTVKPITEQSRRWIRRLAFAGEVLSMTWHGGSALCYMHVRIRSLNTRGWHCRFFLEPRRLCLTQNADQFHLCLQERWLKSGLKR